MNSKSSNGTNKIASNKGPKGPRVILTVAQLRSKLLKDLMVKETRKIESKIVKLNRRESQLSIKMHAVTYQLTHLTAMRAEYAAEAGK